VVAGGVRNASLINIEKIARAQIRLSEFFQEEVRFLADTMFTRATDEWQQSSRSWAFLFCCAKNVSKMQVRQPKRVLC